VSVDVSLEDLPAAIDRRGELCYLVTVGERGPRVVSVSVEVTDAGDLRMEVGRHTIANAAERPAVTILWPPDAVDPTHTLLVDGSASAADADEGVLDVTPTKAILHRVRAGHGKT
jgi:hypothetical protein